jgi:hypothetical protein
LEISLIIFKKVVKVFLIIAGIIIALFFIAIIAPFNRTVLFVANDYRYSFDYFAELDSIPIMSQETKFTCPIVSMAIVKNYFGYEATEHSVRSDLKLLDSSTGILPTEYLTYANQIFEPLSISVALVNPESQADILNIISNSLGNDYPVVIFYSAPDDWNKPHYNTHYSVAYGIDMKNEIIKISNPYGYLEEISFSELYAGLDYSSYESEPYLFRLGRRVGMVNKNNIFTFENIS